MQRIDVIQSPKWLLSTEVKQIFFRTCQILTNFNKYSSVKNSTAHGVIIIKSNLEVVIFFAKEEAEEKNGSAQ